MNSSNYGCGYIISNLLPMPMQYWPMHRGAFFQFYSGRFTTMSVMNPPERKLISNSRLQNKPCITNSCNQKKTHLYASPHTDNEMTKKFGKKKVMCLTLFPSINPKVLVIKSIAGFSPETECEI